MSVNIKIYIYDIIMGLLFQITERISEKRRKVVLVDQVMKELANARIRIEQQNEDRIEITNSEMPYIDNKTVSSAKQKDKREGYTVQVPNRSMRSAIFFIEHYCDLCEIDNGKPIQMLLRNDRWECPECGATKPLDDPPYVCWTCGGPWPECMEHCKLFDD